MDKGRKACLGGLAAVAMLAAFASPVIAGFEDAGAIGPIGGYDGSGWFYDVKSPPLQYSDAFHTTWALHVSDTQWHYAGFLFDLTYDGEELSFLSLHEVSPHTAIEYDGGGLGSGVTFQGSQNSLQERGPIAVWINTEDAMNSGICVETSQLVGLFQIVGHAKNTTAANNSDIDIWADGWVIKHKSDTVYSFYVPSSVYIYVTDSADGWETVPGQGMWLHVDTGFTTTIPASAFIAYKSVCNAAGFGIEHVPEPASIVMLLSGAGVALAGRVRRRRT
jgi:hypothetical protein